MAVDPRTVEIQSPCPVDLDAAGIRGAGRSWHCGHCDKAVHVLSQMTEREAEAFLRDHAGQDVCVSYAMSPSGEIRFRPEPVPALVPLTSLARRRSPRVAAIGVGLALAACAPHDNPRAIPAPVEQLEHRPTPVVIPTAPPAPMEHDDIMVDGGMRVPDPVVEGRIRPPEPVVEAEPCDAPAPPMIKRGTMKRIDR